jgi:metal-sulfur cluster biosynthetic enzyme
MGMVTALEVMDDGVVLITMRATSAMCTVIASIMKSVEDAVAVVAGVTEVRVTLRSDSQWTEAALSEKGRRILEDRRAQSRSEVQVRPHEWKTRVRPARDL